jgi:hypothetical protein
MSCRAGRCLGRLLIVVFLLLTPLGAEAEEGRNALADARDYAVDVAIARPLGFVQLAAGAVLLPLMYPLSWISPAQVDVFEICVGDPAAQTFTRPLGQL